MAGISAGLTAHEVRFDEKPDVRLRTWGGRDSEERHASERRNLPRPPQPGETYRNVEARMELGRKPKKP